ncbi:hypothetical protein ACWEFJ_23525 [Actinosynnema sp. NPDC004786]
MGEGLFRFVFNTLQPRMARAGTRFYLPTVLTNLTDSGGGKVLPLHADRWEIGGIGGESGNTINNMFASAFNAEFDRQVRRQPELYDPRVQIGQYKGIPTPDRKPATLNVAEVTVDGLQNARLRPEPAVRRQGSGYTSRLTIAFGTFPELPAAITVTGGFRLDQWLSIADAKTGEVTTNHHKAPFDWPTFNVAGNGTFVLLVTDLWADVDWTVTVDDEGRPAIGVQALHTRGGEAERPTLKLDDVRFEKGNPYVNPETWKRAATLALNSDDGQRELVARIQDTLNEPEHRRSLAAELTKNLRSTLDRSIGAASASTSVDDDLFQRFRRAVNNPKSDYYLPVGVFSVTSPPLDPYRPEPFTFPVTVLDTPTDITLQGNELVGAANALAPADELVFDPGVEAVVRLSTLPDGTEVEVPDAGGHKRTRILKAPLKLTGTVVVKIKGQDPFDGPYSVSVTKSEVHVVLATSGGEHDALDTLTIRCTGLDVRAEPADITVTAEVGDSFEQIINKELNKPENKRKVVDGINRELRKEEILGELSAAITTNTRALLTARLDGPA